MADLALHDVHFSYGGADFALAAISLLIPAGTMVGLIGPNGSGKSTLLKLITGVLSPTSGKVTVDGNDVASIKQVEVARRIAMVPQDNHLDFPFTVEQVVLMGRYPHLRRWQREGEKDRTVAAKSLEATATHHLAGRPVTSLSGGERQRVAIARALAQEPKVLLLDEPTAHLDIAHQAQILELIRRLNRERGLTVVAALHDLNLAAAYLDLLALLKDGQIIDLGPPQKVLTAENICAVYGVKVLVTRHPRRDCPQVMLV